MPRSPSRDLADRYQGNRTYFRRLNRLERWKWGLSFLALLAAGVYVAAGFVRKSNDYRLTHGPLTNVHATWDSDCVVCHEPAGKVDGAGLLRADKRWAALTCDKCHVGPPHFSGQEGGENTCASCHHDHNGRDNSLVRIADSHCTRCHADLSTKYPNAKCEMKLTDLAAHPQPKIHQPPKSNQQSKEAEFLEKSGLRFSHALHLTPGLTYPWLKGNPYTAASYATQPGGGRYLKYEKNGVFQLECDACHQTDSGLEGKNINRPPLTKDPKTADALEQLLDTLPRYAVRPPRGSGDIFLPVSYDLHCKTCHPNTGRDKTIAGKALDKFPNFHRLQPAALVQRLEREYLGNLMTALLADKKDGRPDPAAAMKVVEEEKKAIVREKERVKTLDELLPLPGAARRPPAYEEPPPPPPGAKASDGPYMDLARQALGLAQNWVDVALKPAATANDGPLLATYCAKCHKIEGTTEATDKLSDKVAKWMIKPTNTPSVWYANAKFNHAAHRGTTCLSCHPGVRPDADYEKIGKAFDTPEQKKAAYEAFAKSERPPPTKHLPGMDECRKCHGPAATTKDNQPVGGVRYGCTECHRYHAGDHPLQGRGSLLRNPDPARQYKTFEEFLGGKGTPTDPTK